MLTDERLDAMERTAEAFADLERCAGDASSPAESVLSGYIRELAAEVRRLRAKPAAFELIIPFEAAHAVYDDGFVDPPVVCEEPDHVVTEVE